MRAYQNVCFLTIRFICSILNRISLGTDFSIGVGNIGTQVLSLDMIAAIDFPSYIETISFLSQTSGPKVTIGM